MSRLSPLDLNHLNTDQQRVYDTLRHGPRGDDQHKLKLEGPFGVWVRAPEVGEAVQALGKIARFGTSIKNDIREIAICVIGAHFRAKFEFAVHRELAHKTGISPLVTEALRDGRVPEFDNGEQQLCYRLAAGLLTKHRIDEQTYRAAINAWGETGVIELVNIIGYYTIVALTLNAFEIPLGAGMQDPFPD